LDNGSACQRLRQTDFKNYPIIGQNTMSTIYQISFRTKLTNALSFQRLHDCLKRLNVKHWAYDVKDLLLSLRSELTDFRSIQSELRSAGFRCDFIKMENIGNSDGMLVG